MRKKDDTVRYTAEQLADLRNRGETRSNWAKAAALTNEEIEAQIAADPDEADMVIDWDSATVEMPQPKAVLNMRIDRDVLEYFRKMGKGYQTRIMPCFDLTWIGPATTSRRLPFFSSVGFPAEREGRPYRSPNLRRSSPTARALAFVDKDFGQLFLGHPSRGRTLADAVTKALKLVCVERA